jgi:ribonuclease P protein component
MRKSLTKRERLKTRAQIDRVFASGKTAKCKGMRLAAAPNDLDIVRVSVIPARGHRNAVARNRTKRLGKEAFRLVKHQIVPGHDVVVVCYPGDFTFADRQEQLAELLARTDLLCDGVTEHNDLRS